MNLQLQPIRWEEACEFIRRRHRHHRPPQGWLFGIGCNDGRRIVGVITIGRPVARMFDDGWTAEVTRCCVIEGTANASSKLYAAARRAVFAMGYRRLITYTLEWEQGTSLRAAGWIEIGRAGGGSWNRENRPRIDKAPTGQKTLWEVLP